MAAQRATFRSAEDLYAQLPVRDVIRVLAKTKQDAEKKREELRDLVGQRYHDLIDSADGIISMNSTVTEFEKTLLTIEQSASVLLQDVDKKKQELKPQTLAPSVKQQQQLGSEQSQIDFLLKAPSEIWSALHASNELKACKIYLRAKQVIAALGLFATEQQQQNLEESGDLYADLIRCAEQDRNQFGDDWQLKFPFLLAQAKLVEQDCHKDIVTTCHAAFSERHITAKRVEKAMEALMLLKQVTNPTETLLTARTKLMEELESTTTRTQQDGEEQGEDYVIVACAELFARTVEDCKLLQRHTQDSNAQVSQWIETFAKPFVLRQTTQCLAKISSLQQLTQSQDHVKEALSGDEDEVFDLVFKSAFQDRAAVLLMQAQETTLKRVKRMLSNNSKVNAHQRALKILQTSSCASQKHSPAAEHSAFSSDAWVEDLVAWLECNVSVTTGRFCELLIGSGAGLPIPVQMKPRLQQVTGKSQSDWVSQIVQKYGEQFVLQSEALPWHQRKSNGGYSSTMGGWQLDESTSGGGDLPAFPSWPCAELCFQVCTELDGFLVNDNEDGSSDAVKKMLGEAVWKHMHATYSQLASTAKGSDGKIQAAFDLEYASIALLGLDRPLLPFSGGVDVYACAGVLKQRAKAYAAASNRLVTVSSKPNPASALPATTGNENTPNLLTLVQPVPRFALLPVPQRGNHAAKLASPKATTVAPSPQQQQQQQQQRTASETKSRQQSSFGRVLGWLS